MRHRVKKIKFRFGKDHNKMLMRKLVVNFLQHNKLTTTLPKAKALKSYLEKVISKAREKTEANKNALLKYVGNPRWVDYLFEKVGPAFKERIGGYVRVVKLLPRESDGAKMARVEWVDKELKAQSAKVKAKNDKKIKVKETSKKDAKVNSTDKTGKGK